MPLLHMFHGCSEMTGNLSCRPSERNRMLRNDGVTMSYDLSTDKHAQELVLKIVRSTAWSQCLRAERS